MGKPISFRLCGFLLAMCASLVAMAGTANSQTASAAEPPAVAAPGGAGRVVGIAFVGRMVANLDKSVAFYKAIGFAQDTGVDSSWHKDAGLDGLFAIKGAQYRAAKLTINSNVSGQPFAVYLRELKDIKRKSLAGHSFWEPSSTHFGLTVPDAEELWSQLNSSGMLWPRTRDGKLVAPPGQTKGSSGFITDPDGLDIELANQRPAGPAENGRPASPANLPGISHIGLVALDLDKMRGFYADVLGGQPLNIPTQWMQGDFVDSMTNSQGNIMRGSGELFPEAAAPGSRLRLETLEYQNRKKAVDDYSISDIGVGYLGLQVQDLDSLLARVNASGAKMISRGGVIKLQDGSRAVLVRDPDVGAFVELFEPPKN